MPDWRRALPASDLSPGRNRFVSLDGLELAIFHLADPDEFHATQNSCPHAGGNLSAGEVAAGAVTCPWHQWKFDLRSGACTHNDEIRARVYPVRVVDEWIEIDVAAHQPESPARE